MSALFCELAWLGGAEAEAGVVIETLNGRIERVSTNVAEPPADAERLDGLVIPGLANAHSHAFQRALRGRTHGESGSFWTWREQMYALADRLNPDLILALARATFAEMVLAGVTLVGEFHYLHHGPGGVPYDDPNATGAAVIQAAAEAGLRLTLLDTCYLHGGIGTAPNRVQQRFSDGDIDAWTDRADRLAAARLTRIGAAIHSVRAVDPGSAGEVAAWAAAREAPLHAHVSEQPAENEACLEAYGATPTGILADAGAITARFTAVHATHVSDQDALALGVAGACCCLCPTTERDLADGIGPSQRLRDAGAKLALGSDSNAIIEPLEEARAIELDERLATNVRGHHTAADLLEAATANGYRSLGWPEGGAIRPGALADFVVLGRGGVRLAGIPDADALQALVFAGAAADVRHVIVDGRFIVRDGRHVSIDVPRALGTALGDVAL